MSDGDGGRGTRWLVGGLLMLLGVSGFLYARLHQYSGQVAVVQSRLLRLEVRDAQLGARLPTRTFPTVQESTGRQPLHQRGQRHVVWVIDPTRCLQCLEGLGAWRKIQEEPGLRAVVLLEGIGEHRARQIVRETTLGGLVLMDSAARWRENRPPERWPAMTVLGVAANGRIRTVAARMARGTCRWSPFNYTLDLMTPA